MSALVEERDPLFVRSEVTKGSRTAALRLTGERSGSLGAERSRWRWRGEAVNAGKVAQGGIRSR